MGALGHYIERAGVPTAQISLIREQTAAIKPPRALWVPFMLGRPFGVPGDAAFQSRVLRALLGLFNAAKGPVLEDFPEDAPADPGDIEGYACPVSFARGEEREDDIAGALLREVQQLAVWHEVARKRRGRSTVGISGMPMEEAAKRLGAFIAGDALEPTADQRSIGGGLKLLCDDLKTYYCEALGAQPGQLSAAAIDKAFWNETLAGRAFIALHRIGSRHPDKSVVSFVERSLVPRTILETMNNTAEP